MWLGTGDDACHYSLGQVLACVAGIVAALVSRSYSAQCLLQLACFGALKLASRLKVGLAWFPGNIY